MFDQSKITPEKCLEIVTALEQNPDVSAASYAIKTLYRARGKAFTLEFMMTTAGMIETLPDIVRPVTPQLVKPDGGNA